MITGFLLSAIYGLIVSLFYFLPAGSAMPTSIITASQSLGSMLYSWNLILPVSDLLIVIGLTLTLLFGIFAVRIIFYVASLFRGNTMPGS